MSDGRVLEARGLVRRYQAEGSPIRAVDGVDLVVEAGETVSVMGPSGCGKSTLLPLPGVLGMRSAWRRLPAVSVPATSLLLLAAVVPVVFAAVVRVPALLLARRPVAPVLAYE
jgi:energy-coupling factor transporter ATP-binding protein EcfA2